MTTIPHAILRGRGVQRFRPATWAVVAVLLAILLSFFSYRAGVHAAQVVTVRSGVAYSSGLQADVTSNGWTYNVPLGNGSGWYGGSSYHQGGMPSCLSAGHSVRLTFGTVSYYQFGALNRTVVWVRCS